MEKIASKSISISDQALKRGVVLLDLKQYRKLTADTVPTYYLTGKKAKALDRLVEVGLREHRLGKTRKIKSLAELR